MINYLAEKDDIQGIKIVRENSGCGRYGNDYVPAEGVAWGTYLFKSREGKESRSRT